MIERATIVRVARSWLGTRYAHQGRRKGVGVDCIGFVGGVALELGIAEATQWLADRTCAAYGRIPDSAMLLGACERYLDPIRPAEALPGDVLVMRFDADPQHFALLSALDPRYIVHAFAQARRVVENRLDDAWSRRVCRAFRFRGIA